MSSENSYNLILSHLEKLENKIDTVNSELQKTNLEMVKISSMKHALNDLKTWKESVDNVVNPEDLRDMKKGLTEIKTATEDIQKVEEELKEIKKERKIDKEEIDKLKTFKTKSTTVIGILAFLFTTALTVLGWFLS